MRTAAAAVCLAAVLLAPPAARAHPLDLGRLDVRVEGPEVDLRLMFQSAGWAGLLGLGVEQVEREELASRSRRMFEAALGRCAVSAGGRPCVVDAGRVEGQGSLVALFARARCPNAGPVSLRLAFLGAPNHPLVVSAKVDGADSTRLADATRPEMVFERAAPPPGLRSFVLLGIEHIFTGYDHLVFLLGLLLAGGSVKRLVAVVSSFTVAHSITLALAALAVVRVPGRVVEPAIAASIMVVAALNVLEVKSDGRWIVAFVFGLIHGFGFASALSGLQLERASLLPALVGFNVGVELGQGGLVLLAAPLLAGARRSQGFVRLGAPAFSLASLAVGACWFVQRVFP